jgi:mannose-1-phosphate guanylyltransferase/mannose-1-phosphate guanylyltransferase/mannose-6-phosphate isomerase
MAAEVVSEIYGDEALMLVMPSDHIIEDVSSFHEAINKGASAARMGRLVTFGIRPAGPDTGYGYLEMGSEIADCPSVCGVAKFVEKPAFELAEAMIQSGNHLWNAGIFLFRADVLLEEAMAKAPLITGSARAAVAAGKRDGIRIVPDALILSECPSESIDYAIMEHSERIAVVPMSPGWSDLGSWDALATLTGTDALIGPITAVDCENCYIRSDGLQVAALGVRDLIIVASGERLLIVPRGRSQEVKKLFSVIDPIAA